MIERLGGRDIVRALGGAGSTEQRQDLVLIEAANRVRRLRALGASEPLPFRIIIALAKADIWGSLTTPEINAGFGRAEGAAASVKTALAVPDLEVLESAHVVCSAFLTEHMPELYATARALDRQFRIVPFSGLGRAPTRSSLDVSLKICPRDVRPVWPAAPIVVALAEAEPLMFPEYIR